MNERVQSHNLIYGSNYLIFLTLLANKYYHSATVHVHNWIFIFRVIVYYLTNLKFYDITKICCVHACTHACHSYCIHIVFTKYL